MSLITRGLGLVGVPTPGTFGGGGGAGLAHRQEMVFPKISIGTIKVKKKKNLDETIKITTVKLI